MPDKADKVDVYLKVTEFSCNPDEIGRRLGIEADKMWRKGDKINRRSSVTHNENGWMSRSRLSGGPLVNEQIRDLLDLAIPKKGVFDELPAGTKVEMYCVVYSQHGRPDISLSPTLIREMGEIGAGLSFDIYVL